MNYSVIEKFVSIDGEGPSAGELATFIRFSGCDLRCSWCDTLYSLDGSAQPELINATEICQYIADSGVQNVTLTGGEPLIQENICNLIDLLLANEFLVVRIETHGGVDITPFKERFRNKGNRVQFIVDFKLPESGMYNKMCWNNLWAVEAHDTYKFVIASDGDLHEAIEIVFHEGDLRERCNVYFSPVVSLVEPSVIVQAMVKEKLNGVKLQLQLHKYIWSKDMRGV